MRDTLGGDLATVPGHKTRRRQGAAASPSKADKLVAEGKEEIKKLEKEL